MGNQVQETIGATEEAMSAADKATMRAYWNREISRAGNEYAAGRIDYLDMIRAKADARAAINAIDDGPTEEEEVGEFRSPTPEEKYAMIRIAAEQGRTVNIHTHTRITQFTPRVIAKFGGVDQVFRLTKSGAVQMRSGTSWLNIGPSTVGVSFS